MTNNTLVYIGTALFVVNILSFVFLMYFNQMRKADYMVLLVLVLISTTSFIVSAYWYRHDEKLDKGTIIPLLAILLSFYLVTQEWNELKMADRPSTGIDGKKISGFD